MNKLTPVLLMLALTLSPIRRLAGAQERLTDPAVAEIKTKIARRLREEKTNVTVRLRNGVQLRGRTTQAAENMFTLKEKNTGAQRDISYADVLLRDVFDCDYDEIASVISKRADTCRQLLRRARQHVTDARARFEVSPEQLQKLASQFALACTSGDLKGLVSALA